jgi:hypothetical protein
MIKGNVLFPTDLPTQHNCFNDNANGLYTSRCFSFHLIRGNDDNDDDNDDIVVFVEGFVDRFCLFGATTSTTAAVVSSRYVNANRAGIGFVADPNCFNIGHNIGRNFCVT